MKISGMVYGLTLAVSGVALGQQVVETPPATPVGAMPAAVGETRRVSQILGSNVNLEGANNFGRVEDIILNDSGAVSYLVVANNGRYVMLPWQAANFNTGNRIVSYGVTPQAVQPLYFQPNAWPNVNDPRYMNRMGQVFPGSRIIRRDVLRPVNEPLPNGARAVEERIRIKEKQR